MSCGKCGNKFTRQEVEVNSLDAVMVTVCMLCGWRKYGASRSEVGALYRQIPVAEVKYHGTYVRAPYQPRAPRQTRPCRVDGCRGVCVNYSESGLCSPCRRRQSRWKNGLRTEPAPFVAHPTKPAMMIHNPERSMSHVASNY